MSDENEQSSAGKSDSKPGGSPALDFVLYTFDVIIWVFAGLIRLVVTLIAAIASSCG